MQIPKKNKKTQEIHYHPVTFEYDVSPTQPLLEYLTYLNLTLGYKNQILNIGSVYFISRPDLATPELSPGLYKVSINKDTITYTMKYGKASKYFLTHYHFKDHNLYKITGDSPIPTYVFEALKSIYIGVITLPEQVEVRNNNTSFVVNDVSYTSEYNKDSCSITLYEGEKVLTVYNLPNNKSYEK